jgi:hypothetical protein
MKECAWDGTGKATSLKLAELPQDQRWQGYRWPLNWYALFLLFFHCYCSCANMVLTISPALFMRYWKPSCWAMSYWAAEAVKLLSYWAIELLSYWAMRYELLSYTMSYKLWDMSYAESYWPIELLNYWAIELWDVWAILWAMSYMSYWAMLLSYWAMLWTMRYELMNYEIWAIQLWDMSWWAKLCMSYELWLSRN